MSPWSFGEKTYVAADWWPSTGPIEMGASSRSIDILTVTIGTNDLLELWFCIGGEIMGGESLPALKIICPATGCFDKHAKVAYRSDCSVGLQLSLVTY